MEESVRFIQIICMGEMQRYIMLRAGGINSYHWHLHAKVWGSILVQGKK
jgi:hypothetical protein